MVKYECFYILTLHHMNTNTRPVTFADLSLRRKKITRTETFLKHVLHDVKWYFVNELHSKLHPSNRGRAPYDTLVLFKMILLQQWYGLSDAEVEELCYDRRSYQEFLGISEDTDIPDETTVCRFRKALQERGIGDVFFRKVQQQFRKKGIRITPGKIVDATICEVPKGRTREDGSSTRDGDASFTKKNNRTYHGYKGHVATDTKGEFITSVYTSTAKDHDSKHMDKVLDGDEQIVFSDSAYVNKEKKKEYRKQGRIYAVIDRASRNHPLSNKQKMRNRKLSGVRCRGEHPFGELKERMEFKLRYRGIRKVDWQLKMVCAAYNLKRLAGKFFPAQKQAVVWCM